eukprot:CAMPEP_0202960080 /NCGR_PEP_ID=MMETSP1396-20130829/4243_1 /ASSEMBLY_ACC=CAM_ASM_000872 /TAXON_ID= /ORGANISM="Pseudokeronopsis sp., Strain Brazil" /LENGTH=44 /DNA_ID= /DNA_START= /DNA_END= /DNA_ORIENTATION=
MEEWQEKLEAKDREAMRNLKKQQKMLHADLDLKREMKKLKQETA